MPFDNFDAADQALPRGYKRDAQRGVVLDLAKPSLPGLQELLLRRELWPSYFKWDYSCTNTCAIGLAYSYWTGFDARYYNGSLSEWIKKTIGLSGDLAHWLFIDVRLDIVVSPDMVSGRIARLRTSRAAQETWPEITGLFITQEGMAHAV